MSTKDSCRFSRVRLKRERAGIIHKQFLLLEKDVPEATECLQKFLGDASKAYAIASEQVDRERFSRGETFRKSGRPKKLNDRQDHEPSDDDSRPAPPDPP